MSQRFKWQSVVFTIAFLVLVVSYAISLSFQNTKLKEKISILEAKNQEDEVFIKNTIITRYEITLEHFKETNPKFAQEFEDWMTKNTE